MTQRKKIIAAVGVVIVLLTVVITAASSSVRVETVTVHRGSVIQTVEDTGYVQAVESYDLFAVQAARVVSVPVKTGQPVVKGQVLVVMDSPDLTVQKQTIMSQAAQAQAGAAALRHSLEITRVQLKEAETNLNRIATLYKAGGVSSADYERAVLAVKELRQTLEEQNVQLTGQEKQAESAQIMLNSLTVQQGLLQLKSPLNGVVLDLPARPEQVAAPGSLLVSVGNPEYLEIKADILSDDLASIKVGSPVKITAPVLGSRVLSGTVKQIYPQAIEKTSALGVVQRRVPVIITLEDKANLQPGYEVRVEITAVKKENVVRVPLEAVRTTPQGMKEVTVVEKGKARLRLVKTGIASREFWEIKSGLRAGEVIVKDGSLKIKDGARVKAQPAT